MQDQRIWYQAAVEEMKITSLLLRDNGKRNHIKNDGLYCECYITRRLLRDNHELVYVVL